MESYIDVRIQKTKLKIYRAFQSLLEKKKVDEISVSEIIDTAKISRGGFYKNYKNKSELIDEILHEMERKIYEKITTSWELSTHDYLKEMFLILQDEEVGRLFQLFISQNGSLKIHQKIKAIFQKLFAEEVIQRINPQYQQKELLPYLLSVVVSNILSILQTWIDNGCQEDQEELINIVLLLSPIHHLRASF